MAKGNNFEIRLGFSPSEPIPGDKDGKFRTGGEKEARGAIIPAGRSDAAYRGQTKEGRCRMRCAIGLASSTLRRPCHIIRRPSEFARKPETTGSGGVVCASSETLDRVALSARGGAGLEDCESLFNHLGFQKGHNREVPGEALPSNSTHPG